MTVIKTHRFEPPRVESLAFYVWHDDRGFVCSDHNSLWARSRVCALPFATRMVADAVAAHHPGSMVLCCFSPGAAPDEQRGYEPKVREYEGEER